ncbi:uncharacterized protein tasor2 [Chanos chanos]|uniref:Uncharacterized protein tasor2 n=1 Tax=Chanos chanos TaxID=29144 RepID=A0A6J2V9L2_CHACN|nr:uncharacterized protein LOC115811074 [Chanos chanos]
MKEKNLALVVQLTDNGFLVLLHSSYFLSYEDARLNKTEALQGMFIFPESRAIQRDTKSRWTKVDLSPDIIQVLPALNYAETEVAKCPPVQSGALCNTFEQHLQNYASLIHPGMSCSPTREASIFPDQYDVPQGFTLLLPSPRWTTEARSCLKSYLEHPGSFTILMTRALELLAAGRQQRSDDQDDDVYYCLSSPEDISASVQEEDDVRDQVNTVRDEHNHCVHSPSESEVQGNQEDMVSEEPVHTALENCETSNAETVTEVDGLAELPDSSSSLLPSDLPKEINASLTGTEDGVSPNLTVQVSDTHCGDYETNQNPLTENQTKVPSIINRRYSKRRRKKRHKKGLHKLFQKEPVFKTEDLSSSLPPSSAEIQTQTGNNDIKEVTPPKKDWRSLPRRKKHWTFDISVKRVLRSDVGRIDDGESNALESESISVKESIAGATKRKMDGYNLRNRYGLKTIITDCGQIFVPHGSEVQDIESLKEKLTAKTSENDLQETGIELSENHSQSTETEKQESKSTEMGKQESESVEYKDSQVVPEPDKSKETISCQGSPMETSRSPLIEKLGPFPLPGDTSDTQHSPLKTETKSQVSPGLSTEIAQLRKTDGALLPQGTLMDYSQKEKRKISHSNDTVLCVDGDSKIPSPKKRKKKKDCEYKSIPISKLKTILTRRKRSGDNHTEPELKKNKCDGGLGSTQGTADSNAQNEGQDKDGSFSNSSGHVLSMLEPTVEAERRSDLEVQLKKDVQDCKKLTRPVNLVKPLREQQRNQLEIAKENGCLNFDTTASCEIIKQADFQQINATPARDGVGGICIGSGGKNCNKERHCAHTSLPPDALTLLADLALDASCYKPVQSSPLESEPGQSGTHIRVKDSGSSESVLHALLRCPSAKDKTSTRSPLPEGFMVTGELILVISKEHSYSQPRSLPLGLSGVPHQIAPSSGYAESNPTLSLGPTIQPATHNSEDGMSLQILRNHTTDLLCHDDRSKNGWRNLSSLNTSLPSSHIVKARKAKFNHIRQITEKEGLIQVTKPWKEKYDFSFDSKFTRDLKERTVSRALHGQWDFNIEDTYEDVHLIYHMWIGLFYSKPTSRFFHIDADNPPLEELETVPWIQELEVIHSPMTEQNFKKCSSERSSIAVPALQPLETGLLDLSAEHDRDVQTLHVQSEVLDLSLKTCEIVDVDLDSNKNRNDQHEGFLSGPEHLPRRKHVLSAPHSKQVTNRTKQMDHRGRVDSSDGRTDGDSDNESISDDKVMKDTTNDGVTESSFTKHSESDADYMELCEQTSNMCMKEKDFLKIQKAIHNAECKISQDPEQKESSRFHRAHETSSSSVNFDTKAVTVFHQVLHTSKPLMLRKATPLSKRNNASKAGSDENKTQVGQCTAEHDGNDLRASPTDNTYKDDSPLNCGSNQENRVLQVALEDKVHSGRDYGNNIGAAAVAVLDIDISDEQACSAESDKNNAREKPCTTTLDQVDSTIMDAQDSRLTAGKKSAEQVVLELVTVPEKNYIKEPQIEVRDGIDSEGSKHVERQDENDLESRAQQDVCSDNKSKDEVCSAEREGDSLIKADNILEVNNSTDLELQPMGDDPGNINIREEDNCCEGDVNSIRNDSGAFSSKEDLTRNVVNDMCIQTSFMNNSHSVENENSCETPMVQGKTYFKTEQAESDRLLVLDSVCSEISSEDAQEGRDIRQADSVKAVSNIDWSSDVLPASRKFCDLDEEPTSSRTYCTENVMDKGDSGNSSLASKEFEQQSNVESVNKKCYNGHLPGQFLKSKDAETLSESHSSNLQDKPKNTCDTCLQDRDSEDSSLGGMSKNTCGITEMASLQSEGKGGHTINLEKMSHKSVAVVTKDQTDPSDCQTGSSPMSESIQESENQEQYVPYSKELLSSAVSLCPDTDDQEWDILDYSMKNTCSFRRDQAEELEASTSSLSVSHVRESKQEFDWHTYYNRVKAHKTLSNLKEVDRVSHFPPLSLVTVFDRRGNRFTRQNYSTEPTKNTSMSMQNRTMSEKGLGKFVQKWEDRYPLTSDVTQSSVDQEHLIFSEKMNQIIRRSRTFSGTTVQSHRNADSAHSPVTIDFSCLDEENISEKFDLSVPQLSQIKVKVDMPERMGTRRDKNENMPLRLRRIFCEDNSEAAQSAISAVTKECALSHKAMMDDVCAGKALSCQTDSTKNEWDQSIHTSCQMAEVCGQLKKDMYARLHDNLNSVVRQACKIKYKFYILETSADPFFKETRDILEAEGHIGVEPHQFNLNSNASSPLLIILRNEDIAEHICEVPHLLELRKSSSVLFAGVDRPDDVVNLTHQELFVKGGFVVFDGTALETLSLDNMKKIVSFLEELSKKGRWKWFLHYRDSRRLRESARSNLEMGNRMQFMECCQEAGIVEVLPYHECDVISRPEPDYLPCLVRLQVQNASARFPVFVTDAPTESFGENGILTMNINTFSRILSNDTCCIS